MPEGARMSAGTHPSCPCVYTNKHRDTHGHTRMCTHTHGRYTHALRQTLNTKAHTQTRKRIQTNIERRVDTRIHTREQTYTQTHGNRQAHTQCEALARIPHHSQRKDTLSNRTVVISAENEIMPENTRPPISILPAGQFYALPLLETELFGTVRRIVEHGFREYGR